MVDEPTGAASYVSGPSHPPILNCSIGEALRSAATLHRDVEAIVSLFQRERLSYGQLDEEADRVAAALLESGVRKGDRVAIWSTNRLEWLVAHHGAVRIGAIVVTVNPAFRAEEARRILADSGARILFASARFRTFSFEDAIASIRGELPSLEMVIIFDGDADGDACRWTDFLAVGGALSHGQRERIAEAEKRVFADDPCSLQYTSGTTGAPKGALLTHKNILNNGRFVGERQNFSERDRICLPVPFFHCFGLVLGGLAAVAHGCSLVLPGEGFDPVETMRAIEDERCTALYGVPMMFIALLSHPDFDSARFRTLRTGAMGGAPCPLPTMEGAIARMNMEGITVVYGMTETSPISFQSLPADQVGTRVSTIGAIHPHLEAKIVDANGATNPRGVAGELCIRGYSVMAGYWNRPDATRDAIDEEGWMHSGDLAVMKDDGYVQIVGRLKDTVIRGGENIYPREVEEFLLTLEPVSEAYAFGIPDTRYGEELCVWIKLKPGVTIDELALRDMCRGRIATYKIPKYMRFVDQFPVTASGKVQRFKMREIELAGGVRTP